MTKRAAPDWNARAEAAMSEVAKELVADLSDVVQRTREQARFLKRQLDAVEGRAEQ